MGELMKSLLIIVICLSSMSSYATSLLKRSAAGEWGSGGGNGLVCFDTDAHANQVRKNKFIISDELLPYIESIEVYDLYEAKKRRGVSSGAKPEIIKIKDGEEFYDYFSRISHRFNDYNWAMNALVDQAKEIVPNSQILFHDSAVKNQNDLGSVTLPRSNCVIVTMAAQVNYSDHYQVHIDERLFFHPKHARQSQATLILHELIYAVGRKKYKHKDSGATRSLIRYFISYHSSITEGSTAKALVDLKFSDGILEGSNHYFSRYAKSDIMVLRSELAASLAQDLSKSLLEFFISSDRKWLEIYEKAKELTKKAHNFELLDLEYGGETQNVFAIAQMINSGMFLNHPSRILAWKELKIEFFNELVPAYQGYSLEEVTKAKQSLNSEFDNLSYLSQSDKEILRYNTDVIFQNFVLKSGNLDEAPFGFFSAISALGRNEDIIFNIVFDAFKTAFDCDENHNNCTGPLKLDHVIPKT